MGEIMQERSAHHFEPHSSPETMGTRCHMCPHLSCIERENARIHRWHYYCEKLRKRYTIKELYEIKKSDCPIGREIRRRFK